MDVVVVEEEEGLKGLRKMNHAALSAVASRLALFAVCGSGL
jgi:hypothetical protein